MAYTNGNLALQPKRKPEQQQQPQYREKRTTVTKRKPLPTRDKMVVLFTILMLVVTGFYILYRDIQIYQINLAAKEATASLDKMNKEIQEMTKTVEIESSPERIKEKAEAEGLIQDDGNNDIIIGETSSTSDTQE
ncbi:cell division protein FtsL [Paenibacillus phyllosphaerae]|uniref:Cell division protein FtsL n=1 Tax=Paenibacillus phyllosphaerae TaxID=274593 RepID=A0A7W5AUJ1_9BACL|nr:cell division initiation protein [Paenibacillus phyllosphaerae]MBB3109050.1 cell division protein FtsL [Paenibacillus phyllosphaerae]